MAKAKIQQMYPEFSSLSPDNIYIHRPIYINVSNLNSIFEIY